MIRLWLCFPVIKKCIPRSTLSNVSPIDSLLIPLDIVSYIRVNGVHEVEFWVLMGILSENGFDGAHSYKKRNILTRKQM